MRKRVSKNDKKLRKLCNETDGKNSFKAFNLSLTMIDRILWIQIFFLSFEHKDCVQFDTVKVYIKKLYLVKIDRPQKDHCT
jgi:hypothetical protein